MLIAVFNNLPEMILGASWSGLCFYSGNRFARWKLRKVIKNTVA